MIKINLLGAAPPPTSAVSGGGPPAPKATQVMMFVGTLIICFGIVGVIYKIWSNQIADLEKRRSQEKIRQTELAVVKAQNDKYQQRLNDLETRINTIQALQNSRVGPVELLSDLGSIVSRTNDVYLYTLTSAGDRLQVKGQSGSVDSMANLLAYLKKSGTFDDVQLEQFYQDDQHDRLTYKFSLSCQFKSVTSEASRPGAAPEGPGTPGATPAGGRGRPPGASAQAQPPRRSM